MRAVASFSMVNSSLQKFPFGRSLQPIGVSIRSVEGWVMRCVGAVAWGVTALGMLFSMLPPARADILVNVSKSQQKLEVIVDGAEAFRWPVSTGRVGHITPSGSFRPHMMGRHWYSHEYGRTPMPYAVFFHRGYAMHGTMESYNLGHAASHGCVRLRPDNAAILYWLVRKHGMKNTKVVVLNGPRRNCSRRHPCRRRVCRWPMCLPRRP